MAASALAVFISLASLGIVVWDKFLRRPKFDVQADWILSQGEPVLRFTVFNVGHRKGTVRNLRLRSNDMAVGTGWTPYDPVMRRLPLVLDADEAAEAFELQPARAGGPWESLDDAVRTGRIDTLEVEDAREQVEVFRLPDLHRAQHDLLTGGEPFLRRPSP